MPWSMVRPYPAAPVPKAGAHLKQPDTIASLDTMYAGAFVKFFQRASTAATRSGVGAPTAGNDQSLHRRKSTSSCNCDKECLCGAPFAVQRFVCNEKPRLWKTAQHVITLLDEAKIYTAW